MNIKLKLSLWYFLFFAILLAGFGIFSRMLLSDAIDNKSIQPWQMRYAIIEENGDGTRIVDRFAAFPGTGPEEAYSYISESFTKEQLQTMTLQGIIDVRGVQLPVELLEDTVNQDDYTLWVYTDIPGNVIGITAVTRSPIESLAIRASYTTILLRTLPFALIFAVIGGFFLIRASLKPVQQMAETVRELESANLDRRLNVTTKDELGYLATTFNTMLGRLQRAFQREKQFTADASHELRAPLAVIQGEVSLTLGKDRSPEEYRESLETIYEETEHMGSVLRRLLFLARYENHPEVDIQDVDLEPLLEELKADVEILCEEKNIECHLTTEKNLIVSGNQTNLRQMFFNIIENAIRYTPEGGKISVNLDNDGAFARIDVSDTGIGIDEKHLERIFQRFFRVNRSQTLRDGGTGLGLAIAKSITEFHGGSISVESTLGEGSTFTIRLPLINRS